MRSSVGPGVGVGRGETVRGDSFERRMAARWWPEGMEVEDMMSVCW